MRFTVILLIAPFTSSLASPIGTDAVDPSVSSSTGTVPADVASAIAGKPSGLLSGHAHSLWSYTCPQGGSDMETFEWSATGDYPLKKVEFHGLQNVDRFGHISMFGNKFSAPFTHMKCNMQLRRACAYRFVGTTVGETHKGGMDLILQTGRHQEDPTVEEACKMMVIPGRPGPCPAFTNADFRPCIVTNAI